MRFEETVGVVEARERAFSFFEDVERVAGCVPGVEEVAPVEETTSRLRLTQQVGSFSATFDLELERSAHEPGRFLEFSAGGRTVKGASGTLRAKCRVEFADADGGGTEIRLSADVALGGMLGSVGHGAVAARAREVTAGFARLLAEAMERWAAGAGSGR